MHQHSLIRLLSHFHRGKMRRFQEFSESPYFNKHQGVRHLVNYLSQKFPAFSEKNLSRTKLLKHFQKFPDFDQKKLGLIFTYTLKVLEVFFRIEEMKYGKNESQEILLFQYLRKNDLAFWYEKKIAKHQFSVFNFGSEQQRKRFLLKSEINEFYNQFRSVENHHYFLNKHIHLDEFFLSEKMKDACEMKLRMRIFNVPNELNFIEKACQQIEEQPELYSRNSAIFVYYNLYKLLETKTLKQYEFTLNYIQENEKKLPEAEIENIYNLFQNFCIERINSGDSAYKKRLFEIYKTQLEKGLLLTSNQLHEEHYKNIVTLGLLLGENDWVLNFLEWYKVKLSPVIRENAFTYNLANYYFSTAQFQEVLQLLTQVEYTEVRYNLGAKFLLLKSYFELDAEEAFLALCTSFGQYLRRNRQIHESKKIGYLNFIKFAKRAFRLKSKESFLRKEKFKTECQKLKIEIEKGGIIFNKNWVLEKLESKQR